MKQRGWLARYPWPSLSAPLVWAACLLLLCALFASVRLADRSIETQHAGYGKLLAETVAGLSAAPLLKQDRIELGLISQRASLQAGVARVRITGVDGEILAATHQPMPGLRVTAPITAAAERIGEVTVTLDPTELPGRSLGPWVLGLALAALMPFVLFELRQLNQALKPFATRFRRLESGDNEQLIVVSEDKGHILIVVNLLNQFSLDPNQRRALLEESSIATGRLADLYRAELEPLRDSGLALRFAVDGNGASARVFQSLCAALVLARYLALESQEGSFRLGLHFRAPGDPETPIQNDTALLAAAASEGQVILSAEALELLEQPERALTEWMEHPLGDDLGTTGPGCYRLYRLSADYDDLLEQQLAALLQQSMDEEATDQVFDGPSTLKESTF